MNNEVYASLAITENYIKFIVGKYRNGSVLTILHKAKEKGHWLDKNDVILNDKKIVFKVKKMINDFTKIFNYELNSIVVVFPTKTIASKEATPLLSMHTGDGPRRIIQEDINQIYEQSKNVNFESDREILNLKLIEWKIDGRKVLGDLTIIGNLAKRIEAMVKVYTISKKVYDSHRNIILKCEKQILLSVFSTHSTARQVIETKKFNNNNAIINWGYENIEISFFARQALIKIETLQVGMADLKKYLSEVIHCKPEIANKYIYKFIDFNSNSSDNALYYRKYHSNNKGKVECKQSDIKKIVFGYMSSLIKKIDNVIQGEFEKITDFNVYHTGVGTKISGFDKIVHTSYFANKSNIYYSTVIGANEIWCTTLCGSIALVNDLNKKNQIMKTSIGNINNSLIMPLERKEKLFQQQKLSNMGNQTFRPSMQEQSRNNMIPNINWNKKYNNN